MRLYVLRIVCFAAAASIGVFPACSNPSPSLETPAFGTAGVGASCSQQILCRTGLACTSGICEPGHSSADNAPCVIDDECAEASYCTLAHVCGPRTVGSSGAGGGSVGGSGGSGGAMPGGEGSSCKTNGDCAAGFTCSLDGLSTSCVAEGKNDIGGACTSVTDCLGGLACVMGTCGQAQPGVPPFGYSMWTGETCGTDTPGVAYFRVPRGQDDGDFYRLPFPNDIRLTNGHPDLSGHPRPGSALLGFDPVDLYIQAIQSNNDGFGAYPTVFFRFGNGVFLDSLRAEGTISWVDVSAKDPDYGGNSRGLSWVAYGGRGQYICSNWMGIRPAEGAPLTPGHTYAVIITTAAKQLASDGTSAGDAFAPDHDFPALLASSPPSDGSLTAAYAAYAPLRAYLASKSIDPSTILTAAVFTVGSVRSPAAKIADAVYAAPVPTASGWIKCGSGSDPCPDTTGDRGGCSSDPSYDELHAVVELPIFQRGTAPYLTPSDGGDIDFAGTPTVQRTEQVCMSLTVPKTAMPAGGWPVLIYAHGTGGSFVSSVKEGVAGMLANAQPVPVAVLSIDQVEHGPRRGSSTKSPNVLFFNFANPGAALGNPLQGAADQIALGRFAASFSLDGSSSPTGQPIAFNPKGIVFWGHSQGATEGGLGVPYSKEIKGAVLSGEGASLIGALLNKTQPVNVAAAVPFALQDPDTDPKHTGQLFGGAFHPVMSLLQTYIDPADPLNQAIVMTDQAPTGVVPHHVFQPYGLSDSYAPPVTEATYAIAANLELVTPDLVTTPGEAPAPCASSSPSGMCITMGAAPPISGNKMIGSASYTAVVREYMPDGSYDGHFVSTKNAMAKNDVTRFLSQLASGVVPSVGP